HIRCDPEQCVQPNPHLVANDQYHAGLDLLRGDVAHFPLRAITHGHTHGHLVYPHRPQEVLALFEPRPRCTDPDGFGHGTPDTIADAFAAPGRQDPFRGELNMQRPLFADDLSQEHTLLCTIVRLMKLTSVLV